MLLEWIDGHCEPEGKSKAKMKRFKDDMIDYSWVEDRLKHTSKSWDRAEVIGRSKGFESTQGNNLAA